MKLRKVKTGWLLTSNKLKNKLNLIHDDVVPYITVDDVSARLEMQREKLKVKNEVKIS